MKHLREAGIYCFAGSIFYPAFISQRIWGEGNVRIYLSVIMASLFLRFYDNRWPPGFLSQMWFPQLWPETILGFSLRSVQSFFWEDVFFFFHFDVMKSLHLDYPFGVYPIFSFTLANNRFWISLLFGGLILLGSTFSSEKGERFARGVSSRNASRKQFAKYTFISFSESNPENYRLGLLFWFFIILK